MMRVLGKEGIGGCCGTVPSRREQMVEVVGGLAEGRRRRIYPQLEVSNAIFLGMPRVAGKCLELTRVT